MGIVGFWQQCVGKRQQQPYKIGANPNAYLPKFPYQILVLEDFWPTYQQIAFDRIVHEYLREYCLANL